jgi:hypothetical protein
VLLLVVELLLRNPCSIAASSSCGDKICSDCRSDPDDELAGDADAAAGSSTVATISAFSNNKEISLSVAWSEVAASAPPRITRTMAIIAAVRQLMSPRSKRWRQGGGVQRMEHHIIIVFHAFEMISTLEFKTLNRAPCSSEQTWGILSQDSSLYDCIFEPTKRHGREGIGLFGSVMRVGLAP